MASALDMGAGWGGRIDISPTDIANGSSIASCVYFDATYLQLSIGYRFQNIAGISPAQYLTWLDAVLLAKYPFILGRFRFYPQVGVEYDPNLTWVDDNGTNLREDLSTEEVLDLNLFYIEAGIGVDISATTIERTKETWHFRIETLFKYNPFLNNYVFAANILYGFTFPEKAQYPK